jgi:uncharacterized protein YecE (DUF72 family)
MSELRVGTSSWTAPSWEGVFYPRGLPAGEWLGYYAGEFDTVEVDATWYRTPAPRVVGGWRARTPAGFRFAVKAPQTITHEQVLVDCEPAVSEFLSSMERLEEKMGAVLFQFPYFRKAEFSGVEPFLARLRPFLAALPAGFRYAVEVRNKSWLAPPLLETLRERGVALALIDHPWMPRPAAWARLHGVVTADFLYVRLLGDRHGIEALTQTWDRLVLDRTRDLAAWRDALRELTRGIERAHVYVNNHFAGCGFQTARQLLHLWQGGEPGEPTPASADPSPTLPFPEPTASGPEPGSPA